VRRVNCLELIEKEQVVKFQGEVYVCQLATVLHAQGDG
jgi:hypothetical protein